MLKQTVSTTQNFNLSDVIIRSVVEEDLPALEWNGEFKHFRLVYANAYARMVEGISRIWIAELADVGLVGQVFLQLVSDRPELADGWQRAYLYAFRIKPPFRNQGLGSKMVRFVEDFLRSQQFTHLTLNVAKVNHDAIRLYRRLGFQIAAEEPGFWSYPDETGTWQSVHEPSWRMEKSIRR